MEPSQPSCATSAEAPPGHGPGVPVAEGGNDCRRFYGDEEWRKAVTPVARFEGVAFRGPFVYPLGSSDDKASLLDAVRQAGGGIVHDRLLRIDVAVPPPGRTREALRLAESEAVPTLGENGHLYETVGIRYPFGSRPSCPVREEARSIAERAAVIRARDLATMRRETAPPPPPGQAAPEWQTCFHVKLQPCLRNGRPSRPSLRFGSPRAKARYRP